ncbi:hypothetical protein GOODEAATRI_020645 [Goodea atripinnis]|uniref:Uncharacterized protein n=1 Tax=Goodea atripinnis TaxID=208336 RepID=A0ABV0N326_9TELE
MVLRLYYLTRLHSSVKWLPCVVNALLKHCSKHFFFTWFHLHQSYTQTLIHKSVGDLHLSAIPKGMALSPIDMFQGEAGINPTIDCKMTPLPTYLQPSNMVCGNHQTELMTLMNAFFLPLFHKVRFVKTTTRVWYTLTFQQLNRT